MTRIFVRFVRFVFLNQRVRINPLFEDRRKLMIRDDDMFIDLRNPVDIIQHPPENRVLPNLQQWLREVLGQFT